MRPTRASIQMQAIHSDEAHLVWADPAPLMELKDGWIQTNCPHRNERINNREAHLSTAYPQAKLLNSLQVQRSNLTGLWHAMCNECPFANGFRCSRMSKQRLPQTIDADRPTTRRQRSFVDHILTTGESIAKCAEHFGIAPTNIYRDLRKPHVRKYLHEQTLAHIGILAPMAAGVQQKLLTADSDHVRASVAENILDRHLGKPVMRQQIALQGQINVVIDLA